LIFEESWNDMSFGMEEVLGKLAMSHAGKVTWRSWHPWFGRSQAYTL